MTLGVTGPTGFADGTAASFGGSDSEITVPGGYFTAAGGAGESVELWFTATKAGTLLSTGSGTGGNPPTLWVNSSGCVEGEHQRDPAETDDVRVGDRGRQVAPGSVHAQRGRGELDWHR